jgi:hypothetical protein
VVLGEETESIEIPLNSRVYRASPSAAVMRLVGPGVPVPLDVGRTDEVNDLLPEMYAASLGSVPAVAHFFKFIEFFK